METAHVNVRLTVSGPEVNLLVKVGLPHIYVQVEERGFQHLLLHFFCSCSLWQLKQSCQWTSDSRWQHIWLTSKLQLQ